MQKKKERYKKGKTDPQEAKENGQQRKKGATGKGKKLRKNLVFGYPLYQGGKVLGEADSKGKRRGFMNKPDTFRSVCVCVCATHGHLVPASPFNLNGAKATKNQMMKQRREPPTESKDNRSFDVTQRCLRGGKETKKKTPHTKRYRTCREEMRRNKQRAKDSFSDIRGRAR